MRPLVHGMPGPAIVSAPSAEGLLNDAPSWTNDVSTSSNVGPPTRDRDRLTDHDKSIIGQAHQLVVSGPAAIRAYLGTIAASYADTAPADTAPAYAAALSQATRIIGELLAIIDRLADIGAAVILDSESDQPPARSQPESGGQAEVIRASSANAPADTMLVRPRMYEITFTGRAGDVLRAAFDDCTVTVGPGTTTLRAQLPDQAAVWGLVQRIIGLGLEVVDLHVVAPGGVVR
jgi:hypothetical protein